MSPPPTNDDPPADERPAPDAARPEDEPPDLSSVSLSAAMPLGVALGPLGVAGDESDAPADQSKQATTADPPATDDRAVDERLIDRTLAGDSAAFGQLVGRYQDRLRGSLTRLTGSNEEAEDVAQEAFVQSYLKLSTFQRSSRYYTWLYRIAFNLAISKSRKRRPRVSLNVVQEAGGPEPECELAGPAEPALEGERAELLHAAIAELAEDHRQVLVLREFDGMDYQQIAEVIDAPIGTVRSRLFRARTQLRDRLAGVLGEEGEGEEGGPEANDDD